MDEGGGSGSAAGGSELPRVLTDGGRQRFQVELRPGETTIVSWKKLVKDANRAAAKAKSPAKELPVVPKPAVESHVDPVRFCVVFICFGVEFVDLCIELLVLLDSLSYRKMLCFVMVWFCD